MSSTLLWGYVFFNFTYFVFGKLINFGLETVRSESANYVSFASHRLHMLVLVSVVLKAYRRLVHLTMP